MVFTPELHLVSAEVADHFLGRPREASVDTYEDFLSVALEKIAGIKDRQ